MRVSYEAVVKCLASLLCLSNLRQDDPWGQRGLFSLMSSGPPDTMILALSYRWLRTVCHSLTCFRVTTSTPSWDTGRVQLSVSRPWKGLSGTRLWHTGLFWAARPLVSNEGIRLDQLLLPFLLHQLWRFTSALYKSKLYGDGRCTLSYLNLRKRSSFLVLLSNRGHNLKISNQPVLLKSYPDHLNLWFPYCWNNMSDVYRNLKQPQTLL